MYYTGETPYQQAVALLLIQQRYRLCGVQEEDRVAFGPIKPPPKYTIDIACLRVIELATEPQDQALKHNKGKKKRTGIT